MNGLNGQSTTSQKETCPITKPIQKSLADLIGEIDPNLQLDQDTEEALNNVAEEFITKITAKACKLAEHRDSNVLEPRDIQFFLEHDWDIPIQGFPSDEKTWKRSYSTEAHRQRLAMISKQIKKM
ncbi:Transcription initiation factor TFIID subunit 12 [Cichlidogyrus casuarinus]|uniref:Transcription initiation factor TFIID subunit 12 n=1 Tax=Cichlidogyrus casuarinus TaxID=1844966 RepID=A0ABD2Q9W6_9PLAT